MTLPSAPPTGDVGAVPEPAPSRGDLVVAGVTLLVAVIMLFAAATAAALDPDAAAVPAVGSRAWWAGTVAVTLQAIALVWRRRRPGLVLTAVAALAPVAALAGAGEAVGITTVAVLVAAYTVAVGGAVRRGTPALLAAAGLVAVGTFLGRPEEDVSTVVAVAAALVQGLGAVGLPGLVGVVVATRRESVEAQARQVAALSREHGARVEAAVARERAEMARELHDIAAHHLSGIAVMAGAISRQIDVDPQAAKAGVERVRAETSAMLDELRSLVRLLRDTPAPDDGESRVESLTSIPDLVDRVRAAGVDATLTVLGTDDGRPPADSVGTLAQLAVHRTVQEALANVVRHARGARCEVVLDARDASALVVSVRNGPPSAPPPAGAPTGTVGTRTGTDGGLGLVGMQERADLTDAHLTYGPQPDGGWQVTLTVPTHAHAAPPSTAGTSTTEGAPA